MLLASIFCFDLFTVSDHVSVSFAYTVPIILSLLEPRPRPIHYAAAAGVLSLVGTFIQPPADISVTVLASNRSLAVFMQWLAAILVMLQHRRLLEAQEKTETQRRLVDILSHEVGTALTTVTGQAYRLTRLTGPISPVDLRTRAEKLRRAVDRIQTIISRIQIASSLGDGTIPTSHEQIDVRTVVQQIVEQFAEDRSGQIELHLPPAPTIVAGEELMLRQIFENLISNSIKYSTPDSTIEVSVALVAAGVMTTISDHGSGISKDDLQRIRAAYYRGENSKGISGAGLGLHVVDRLIEAHHGRMIIESEIGRGTTIKVELPRAGPLQ